MVRRAFFTACFAASVALISGCGASPSAPVNATPAATPPATLTGSYLVAGTVPPYYQSIAAPSTGFTLGFDVQDGKLIGSASLHGACASGTAFSDDYIRVILGTVNTDGTFTATFNSTGAPSIVVKGSSPATAGGSWTGTYGITDTSCGLNTSASFTAQPIQVVSGTYSGSAPLSLEINPATTALPAGTPIGVTAKLQQGGTWTNNGASLTSQGLLDGSIQVTGIPCFKGGTASAQYYSLITGTDFVSYFSMDDGSILTVLGNVSGLSANQLNLFTLNVDSGACKGTYYIYPAGLTISR